MKLYQRLLKYPAPYRGQYVLALLSMLVVAASTAGAVTISLAILIERNPLYRRLFELQPRDQGARA